MHTQRLGMYLLLVALASVGGGCSYLLQNSEYALELSVSPFALADAQGAHFEVRYRVSADDEVLRAQYLVARADGDSLTVLEEGLADVAVGQWYSRTVALEDPPVEGRYCARVTVQSRKPDGSYAGLAFLDQTVDFYVDSMAPAPPIFSPAEGGMHVGDVAVAMQPAADPAGSPVEIRYTLDGTDPGPGSPKYTAPVTVPSAAVPPVLKAVAIDAAGNCSGVAAAQYGFFAVLAAQVGAGYYIDIFGYGFGQRADIELQLLDGHRDTQVSIAPVSVNDYDPANPGTLPSIPGANRRIWAGVDYNTPDIDFGTGLLTVTDIRANVTDSIEIVLPPPP